MREYAYKARDISGGLVQGRVEAENEQSASNLLTSKKLIPVDIKEASKDSFNISFLSKLSRKDKVFFIRQLATMTKAGLPISQSLSTLQEQTSSKKIKEMLTQMTRDIESGESLSSAFSISGNFNKTEISMVTAGEASGKLDDVLTNMAVQEEKGYKTSRKIKTVFIYPAFLILVIIAVVAVMMIYVLPQMAELYKTFNSDLPLPTRILMATSDFVRKFYLLMLPVIVATVIMLVMYVRTKTGKYLWHSIKLKIPLMKAFLQMTYMATFTRTMSGLVTSGVPILDALEIVGNTMPNVLYMDAVLEARGKVKQGKSLSVALKEDDIFPVMSYQMISVGENTGELDNMLNNLADYYDEEIDNWVRSFQSLLEPIMIVVMGLIVGSIIIAIIMPIYSIGFAIRK